MTKRLVSLVSLFGLMMVSQLHGQTVEIAKDYYQHGLNEKAKDMLLTLVHSAGTAPASKAKALYQLGQISFDEGHIRVAMGDWEILAKDYPQSAEAKEINDRLSQLSEIVSKEIDENVSSAVAKSYLSNGDFWSIKREVFTIDSSYLESTDLATAWYDRVIKEFPGTDAAELAYKKKLFVLVGYREPGEYGESWGVKRNFQLYMPKLLSAFAEMEAAFPKSPSLQGFRYQIAQAYWVKDNKNEATKWLQAIVSKQEGNPTFYTEAAKARLANLK